MNQPAPIMADIYGQMTLFRGYFDSRFWWYSWKGTFL